MRYIHQHPAETRRITDISRELGMGESQLSKIVRRDFPHVFYRIPKVGLALTGKWPVENTPIDLRIPWNAVNPRTYEATDFQWDPLMLKTINSMWKAYTQQTLLESLQVAEMEDAQRVIELGKHMTEMAEQLIRSGVIGTARQDEWTPE
jgi:hypothetical protein